MGDIVVHVAPEADPRILSAVRAAGARVGPSAEAEALIWTRADPAGLAELLTSRIRWVQLPAAGVERWIAAGLIDAGRTWTSATGAYARQVAEHAIALLLAGVHGLHRAARRRGWVSEQHHTLHGADVAVVGAGGIGRALIPGLRAFGARVIAVNRTGRPVAEADETWGSGSLAAVWPRADHVILAAPATPETYRIVDAPALQAMRRRAWLVNIARGELIDTSALLVALRAGQIAGAALDVTDPEPLPDDHELWREPRALITAHTANPADELRESLVERVRDNVGRYIRGEPLVGRIDLGRGY